MHVHFINLDRTPERLAAFKAVNAHLTETTRVPAIDESRLDMRVLAQQGLVQGDILSMYPVGAVCNALSHLALWNQAIQTAKPVTVADDDAVFNFKFSEYAPQVIGTLPPDWDFILWGWNFDLFMIFDLLPGVSTCLCQFDQPKMQKNMKHFQELTVAPSALSAQRVLWAFGLTSYTVSPGGAQKLRSKCFPLRPIMIPCPDGIRAAPYSQQYRNVGIDNTLNSIYRELNAYCCLPPLVISENDKTKSTIGHGDNLKAISAAPRPPQARAPTPSAEDVVLALNNRAIELQKLGRLDQALEQYDRLLTTKPDAAEAHFNRGNVLKDLKRYGEALASYDKALALKPDFVVALNNRGWILQVQERLEEALKSYDQALAIKPDHATSLANRKLILQQLGRPAEG